MESKKAATGEADLFNRLPEELLLYIFSKVADLKSLCQCSLVSKHFASVISHTRTISITLHGDHSFGSYKNMSRFFRDLQDFDSEFEHAPALHELLSLQKPKLPIFLENFKELESIYLEYTYPEKIDSPSFLKWKIKCRSRSALVGSFIVVSSASVHKITEYEPDDEQEARERSWEFIVTRVNDGYWLSYMRYIEWLCLVSVLVKSHASLKSVRIVDSEKQGNLVITDKQIVKIRRRRSVIEKKLQRDMNRSFVKFAWVPELLLPLSGYVMRGVCLMIIKVRTKTCANAKINDDDNMSWDFEDKENVFGEAVKEILKNHRDKIRTAD